MPLWVSSEKASLYYKAFASESAVINDDCKIAKYVNAELIGAVVNDH